MKKNHIPPGFPEVLPYMIVRDTGKFLDFLVAVSTRRLSNDTMMLIEESWTPRATRMFGGKKKVQ